MGIDYWFISKDISEMSGIILALFQYSFTFYTDLE